jgi:LmbE family N-acetylglucosaminyl deacetylase
MDLIPSGARVLSFSPHPDDTELGVGATLSKYRDWVAARVVVLSDRRATRNEERNEEDQAKAIEALGVPRDAVRFVDELGLGVERLKVQFFGTEENRDLIRRAVTAVVAEWRPDFIFIPALRETFQDHSALAEEVVRIARGRYMILGYEVPKHNRYFQPTVYVEVGSDDVEAKIVAVNAYSEFTTRYYFEPEGIRALARSRALQAGYIGFAEAFELYHLSAG